MTQTKFHFLRPTLIIPAITIVVMALFTFTLIFRTNPDSSTHDGNYTHPDYNPSAVIYHSEMLGIDAGTDYTYHIYRSTNSEKNSYFYIKSKSTITIAGSSESTDIDSGSLENKSDLGKITKDIKKDTKSNAEQYISYHYYTNDETPEKCENMKELANKLF